MRFWSRDAIAVQPRKRDGNHAPSVYAAFGKRALDICLAGAALVVLAPLIVATALAVCISLGRPVLFRQQRPGKGGRLFTILKFRTMKLGTGGAHTDEARLTTAGRRIRSWSLDELPELLNVLKGDMSLVGPRPLLMEYVDRYTPEQARRHDVKPGITGLAQISGRNELSWEDKFKLDVEYVNSVSLLVDFKILGLTVVKVLQREGITADGRATVPEFTGSKAGR